MEIDGNFYKGLKKLQKSERRIRNKEDGGTLKCIIVKNYRLEQFRLKSYMTYPLVNNGGFESVSRRSSKDWP